MRSLLSEFSYGFALTHELVQSMGTLSAAPVFPSLIAEGSPGGGWDVHLDRPGVPIYIQFKRSECILIRSGKEIRLGADLLPPYYRFAVTASADSKQHEMLLTLDVPPNEVFYAAPMFHTKPEFDVAFLDGEVRQKSFFVRPRDIGPFTDGATHHVSFDGRKCYRMSEPVEIEALGIGDLERHFGARLAQRKEPLREQLPQLVNLARRLRDDQRRRETRAASSDVAPVRMTSRALPPPGVSLAVPTTLTGIEEVSRADEFLAVQRDAVPAVPFRPVASDDEGRTLLDELADISIRDFNAQLYVVQRRE